MEKNDIFTQQIDWTNRSLLFINVIKLKFMIFKYSSYHIYPCAEANVSKNAGR
jgi:hypothetical protein